MPPHKNGRVPNSDEFRGGMSWTLLFFRSGQLGTFFLDSWGGKKDQTQCTALEIMDILFKGIDS